MFSGCEKGRKKAKTVSEPSKFSGVLFASNARGMDNGGISSDSISDNSLLGVRNGRVQRT